jgi:hypothetical protein
VRMVKPKQNGKVSLTVPVHPTVTRVKGFRQDKVGRTFGTKENASSFGLQGTYLLVGRSGC